MNPLLQWLTSPEWTTVVGALLHSLWQGAIIAIALAFLMRRLANPVTRYRCALVTLGLVVMAGIVTWAVLNAPKSAFPIAGTIPVTEPAAAPVATAALNPDSADKIVALGRMSPPPEPKYWIAWLAGVWMLGTVAMLLRAGIKVAGAENLRRSCQPLNDERMVALVAEARRAVGLARQIRVAVTDKLTSPAVVGVIVPTLILPLSLFTALTPEQIRFILLHEMAHIRRGDYFANLFQLLAEALLFFNPAVWWISHQIRREREACCDALAIELSGAPADYARTLVQVAENILHPATTAALAFGNGQRGPSSLADRVQRLLVPGYRPALRLTWRAMLASLIVGGTLLVLSAVGTRNTVGAILSSNQVAAIVSVQSNAPPSASGPTRDKVPILGDLPYVKKPTKDKVVLGDLPFVGRLFRSESSNSIPRVADDSEDPFWTIGPTPTNPATTQERPTRSFEIDLNAFYAAVRKSAGLPATTTGTNLTAAIRPFFAKAAGVSLDPQSGRGFMFSDSRGQIAVTATTPELDAIQALLQPLSGPPLVVRFFKLAPDFLSKATNGLVPAISSVFATNPAAGFQALLESIDSSDPRPKRLMYEQERGLVVVRATDADLDKFESNIKVLLDTHSGGPFRTVPAPASAVDLATRTFMVGRVEMARALGQVGPVQVTNAAAMVQELMVKAGVDLKPPKTVVFKDSLGLLLVRATKGELDTIEKFLVQANQGAASGTLPSGPTDEPKAMIPILMKTPATAGSDGSTNLQLRVYAVDARAMVQVLKAVGTIAEPGGKSTNDGRTLLPEIRKLFASLGVDLQPPKTVFFNEPKGQLLVHATQADLDRIEEVVQVLNDQPPQINIKVKWVEFTQNDIHSLGLDWFLGNLLLGKTGGAAAAASSVSSSQGTSATANSSGQFFGVLTDPQFRVVIKALDQRGGADLLNEGDVTTLSGRQCQIQTTEMKTIVTGINPKALTRPGVTATNDTGSAFLETQLMPFGPAVNVIPTVSRDQANISLRVIPTLTEFLGYGKTKSNVPIYVNGKRKTTILPLPKYRLQQMTNDCVILDGQTLMLGNFPTTEIAKQPNGEFLTNAVTGNNTKFLFVFVTPTLIDPAGNRVNTGGK